jgi:2-dehydropantoate 2-reductase
VVRDRAGVARRVAVAADTDVAAAADAEVVLVATKGQDTEALVAAHAAVARAPVAAWSVQNGVHQARPLVAAYGPAAIGCSSMVGATLDEPGVVTHTFLGATYVGPLPSSSPAAGPAVAASLAPAAGVEVRDDITDVLWSKAVLATGAMGLSALLRLPYHHLFVEPGARHVFYDVIADAAAVAVAEGATLVDLPGPLQAGSLLAGSRRDALDRLAAVGQAMVASGQTTTRVSMLQSLETGRRLEVQAVFADLLAVADRHGLAVPLLRAVAALVGVLDDVNARRGGER